MELSPDVLEDAYLKNQLIAYIGNKRRLLGFLAEVFSELESRCTGTKVLSFGDCFAGSGSVSRLAKMKGFSVASNDWELYSNVINTAHLMLSPGELDALFAAEGGISVVLAELNNLPQPKEADCYISRYYAPASTESADYRYERLFYTRENALFIDAVRERIEQRYPGWELSESDYLRKCALTAPLLYQAATHANTNGVFKAYHKGFGGHGADALTRIMADMQLQLPLTIDNLPGRTFNVESCDAADFAAGKSFDICYLDPPYNQHQYGSNYFMLNTIAGWDKPEVSMDRSADGRLEIKAGIRSDWNNTRSGFCYRKTAPAELSRLIENIDARFIVLSYNTEGIIPFDELFEILASYGKTEIFCRDYIIYRGGRQSIGRSNRNVEFQLVLSKGEKAGAGDRSEIDKLLRVRSIVSIMNESFVPERVKETFSVADSRVELSDGMSELDVRSELCYRFLEIPTVTELSSLSAAHLNELLKKLEYCRCRDKHEESRVLMELIRSFAADGEAVVYRRLWTSVLKVVRKFAFRKYKDVFEKEFIQLQQLAEDERKLDRPAVWASIDKRIEDLRRVVDLRLNG